MKYPKTSSFIAVLFASQFALPFVVAQTNTMETNQAPNTQTSQTNGTEPSAPAQNANAPVAVAGNTQYTQEEQRATDQTTTAMPLIIGVLAFVVVALVVYAITGRTRRRDEY